MLRPSKSSDPVLNSGLQAVLCRICGGVLTPVIDFGKMPLANGFLKKEDFETEYFFNLAAGVCEQCRMFQLLEQPNPALMFHESYPFFTGSSFRMAEHFKKLAEESEKRFLKPGSSVVEIGCNDGTLLGNFFDKGYRCLGIEPSANTARRAAEKGIPVREVFFNAEEAALICGKQGLADLILAANCFCHIPGLLSVLEGIDLLLSPSGVLVIEDPYLGDVLHKTSYDQIYDEHVFLFSVTSMTRLLELRGFEIFDLEPQWTHGGSMRFWISRRGAREISPAVGAYLLKEETSGIKDFAVYENFRIKCERSRDHFLTCLHDFKKRGVPVCGYAATSKSTTVLNYCGIGTGLIESIFDTTPEKQGKFTPGTHIPVRPYEEFSERKYPAAVLFAWNHAGEILSKETSFRKSGGKWIHYIPEVRVE